MADIESRAIVVRTLFTQGDLKAHEHVFIGMAPKRDDNDALVYRALKVAIAAMDEAALRVFFLQFSKEEVSRILTLTDRVGTDLLRLIPPGNFKQD